jgi:hypothetical protein
MKGGGLALLWLFVPSLVMAAPAASRGARVCHPQTVLTLHKLARVARSFSGPVARPFARATIALPDGVRLQRGVHATLSDDDAAIQNDAPAAWVDADTGLAFALEPLGLLARACVRHLKTHDFSPRSPRGPPAAA